MKALLAAEGARHVIRAYALTALLSCAIAGSATVITAATLGSVDDMTTIRRQPRHVDLPVRTRILCTDLSASHGSSVAGQAGCWTEEYTDFQCWEGPPPTTPLPDGDPLSEGDTSVRDWQCEYVVVTEVVCPEPDHWFPSWWDDPEYQPPMPEPDPELEQGGGGGGGPDTNQFGKDNNRDGYADCEWTAVDSSHPRGQAREHFNCQLYGVEGCGRSSPHRGLDYSANVGDVVRSVTKGRVTEISESGPNGKFIRIYNDDTKVEATYIHLDSQNSSLQAGPNGTIVVPGQAIGTSGQTGPDGTKPHLHLQFKNKESNQTFDPLSKMQSGC